MSLVLTGAVNFITSTWNQIMMILCWGIYKFVGGMYQVFEKIAGVNLFSEEVFNEITGRIYVVVGIAMLFIFAYNLIIMIINPDQKKGTNNQMASIVKNTIISLGLIILLPVVFNYMYVLQAHVLESNVLGVIILGDVGTTQDKSNCEADDFECKCEFSNVAELKKYNNSVNLLFGIFTPTYSVDKTGLLELACEYYRKDLSPSQRGAYSIAPTVLSAFYSPVNFSYTDCYDYLKTGTSSIITSKEDKQICVNYFYDVNMSKYVGSVATFVDDQYLSNQAADLLGNNGMELDGLMAVVAGIMAVIMFFIYSWQIGVRVAKLGFLQLISPIPVMLKIIPNKGDNVFKKWLEQLMGVYLEVFARLAIIYFCLFAISLVPEVLETLFISTVSSSSIREFLFIRPLASVLIILGILKFGMDAPKLFKELFGGMFSGGVMDLALKSPKKMLEENKPAMGAGGAVAGGVNGALSNLYQGRKNGLKGGALVKTTLGGAFGGARRGAVQGYKASDTDAWVRGMKQAKYETDEAREKRKGYLEDADKKGYTGPFRGKFVQGDEAIDKYVRFIQTDGSDKVGANAAVNVLKEIKDKMDNFENGEVTTIKDAEKKTNESFVTGKEVEIKGEKYTQIPDGSGRWSKDGGITPIEKDDMKTIIDNHFKELKFDAFAKSYEKAMDTYRVQTENVMASLHDNFGKLGEDFGDILFTKLNSIDGVSVASLDDLQSVYTSLIDTNDVASRRKLAEIDDAVESVVKGRKKLLEAKNSVPADKDKK